MQNTTLTLTAPVFYPALPGGYRQFYHYANGLAERGVGMKVFTNPNESQTEARETINGIQIINVECQNSTPAQERRLLLKLALQEAHQSLNHSSQVIFPLGIDWMMAKRAGIGSIIYISTAPELPAHWWSALRTRLSTSLLLSTFDQLVFCSNSQISLHRRFHWISRSKSIAIPNGVRTERFHPVNEAQRVQLRHQLGLAHDEILFCYAGNIVERKGIDFLIRAWRQVQARQPKARLILLGQRTMPETFRTEELQHEHRLFESRMNSALELLDPTALPIIFKGQVEEVEMWLQACDAFLFPSYLEGLPNALLEAMSCGLPCVTAPFAGFPNDGEDLGRQGHEFLLVPHDEKAWAETIVELAMNPQKRVSLGNAAHLWAKKYHDYDKVLDQFAELYHRIGHKNR